MTDSTPASAPLPNDGKQPDTAAICWPTFYGDVKIDRRRRYKHHDFIQQPFYNQDGRVWCRRCGLLTEAESA